MSCCVLLYFFFPFFFFFVILFVPVCARDITGGSFLEGHQRQNVDDSFLPSTTFFLFLSFTALLLLAQGRRSGGRRDTMLAYHHFAGVVCGFVRRVLRLNETSFLVSRSCATRRIGSSTMYYFFPLFTANLPYLALIRWPAKNSDIQTNKQIINNK